MGKKTFITIFISAHLLFAIFQIDKQSRLAKLSYIKQTYEVKIKSLKAQKQECTNRLHAFQNHQKIKLFAKNELGMQPLFLKNLKHLKKNEVPSHECNK